jgi:hypothetical protein
MHRRAMVSALLGSWSAACQKAPAPAIDPELAAGVAPDAVMVAGVQADELRGTPVHRLIAALMPSAAEARQLVASYNGKALFVAAKGPRGVQVLGGTLRAGQAPADLMARAAPLAAAQMWAVVRGGVTLPLAGNAANVNRLLRLVEYATLDGDLRAGLHARLRGYCRSPEEAAALEQTVRALLTLARVAGVESVTATVERQNRTVTVHLTATAEEAASMLDELLH